MRRSRKHGARNGPIGQWLEDGTQALWGEFQDNKETGIWTVRGPEGHEGHVAYAVYVDGKDVTEEMFRKTPSDCTSWVAIPEVQRAGVIAVVNLLALEETTFWKDTNDRAQVAACIALYAIDAARELDAACQRGEALGDVIVTVEGKATVECMALDSVKPSQR